MVADTFAKPGNANVLLIRERKKGLSEWLAKRFNSGFLTDRRKQILMEGKRTRKHKVVYAVYLMRQRKATRDQTQERHMGFDLQPVRESAEIFHLVINNNLNCKLSINFCDELKLS